MGQTKAQKEQAEREAAEAEQAAKEQAEREAAEAEQAAKEQAEREAAESEANATATHLHVQFSETIGPYKEGSTHLLDRDLARHYCTVKNCGKVVRAPQPTNRMIPGSEPGSGSLNTNNGPVSK